MSDPRSQCGAAVLVALLVVLGVGSAVIALTGHVIAVEQARLAKARSVESDAELEAGFAELLVHAAGAWREGVFSLSGGGRGSLAASDCPDQLLARVEVSQGGRRAWGTAVLERALDGLDLPRTALTAGTAVWDGPPDLVPVYPAPGEIEAPVMIAEGSRSGVEAAGSPPPVWDLDEGSRILVQGLKSIPGTEIATLAVLLPGSSEQDVWTQVGAAASGTPTVVVALDRDLDARGRGDLHGVLVCGGGDILLEGTTVHGAVLCSGVVDFGRTGAVRWVPRDFRAATDALFWRYRFAPGSFGQGVVGAADPGAVAQSVAEISASSRAASRSPG